MVSLLDFRLRGSSVIWGCWVVRQMFYFSCYGEWMAR